MTSVLHYRDPIAYRSDFMSTSNYTPPHIMDSLKKVPSYDGHSSESESRKNMSGGKKRPSRAGTRSVTTLTAAQLERKRANDREAQRAIRQRTKDHIDTLERQVRDLTSQLESSSSSKMIDLMRRNEELEQENAMLRARMGHAPSTLGVPEHNTAGAPSPSDRIQMLSQPRRSSTGTARSSHSVPEMATSASQAGHWQTQHSYAHHVSSPHVEAPPPMEVSTPHHDSVRWSPHPSSHPQHHAVSMADHPSVHAVEPYPSPYVMESNARAMSYPLENASLVSSQPMQMTGYGTPTSHPSPHPSEYQRHMSVPMNHQAPPQPQHPHPHAQQQTSAPYPSYAHQGYVPQVSHPGDMSMMAHAPHSHPQSQSQMMGEHGQHMMYMQPNMKVEH
ncbi:sequence-specific DNA binding [Ascochyta rabiei]|uniref:Sequence-specific DNA binding n=1 Tax=Didymella rabiei TaxID=5454 RepID=A0A163D796_DIDRA|nr:sequence-specific DNA binding [Ascochyta rabiei]